MSGDVVRNYSGGLRGPSMARPRRRRPAVVRYVLLLVLLGVLAWAWYVTRDTHAMPRLIPGDQGYAIAITNLLEKRQALLDADVWELLPRDNPLREARARLAGELPTKEWVLNNLLHGVCHVSGPSLQTPEQFLFVTRMSRFGALMERFAGYALEIETDHAGGLDLRYVPEAEVHYAVRGRILLVSPERDLLIKALTLTEERSVAPDVFAQRVERAMSADFAGTWYPDRGSYLGDALARMDVSVRLGHGSASLDATASLRPSWRSRHASVLPPSDAAPIPAPPSGLITIAADLGRPLPVFLERLDTLLVEEYGASPLAPVTSVLSGVPPADAPLAAALPGLAGAVGNEWWVNWTGVDLDAMVPMPLLMARFDCTQAAGEALLASFPAEATDPDVPRQTEEGALVHVPYMGGPALEPSMAWQSGRLLVSPSRSLLDQAVFEGCPEEPLEAPANLLVRVHPEAAARAAASLGQQIADVGLMRGHDGDSFREWAAAWVARVRTIETLSARLACQGEGVDLSLRVALGE